MFGMPDDVPEELTRRGRAGYYALITYLDDKIGRLLAVLDETGQREKTVVVYTSDHGEMAGEHGMWRKSSFYEQSARVPRIVAGPGITAGRRIQGAVSLVDLVATVAEIAGAPPAAPLDGERLLHLLRGETEAEKDKAFCEYLAHGVAHPMAMLRCGQYKLNYYLDDPPELYDLDADPGEFANCAAGPVYRAIVDDLRARLLAHWDPVALEQRMRQSQREGMLIHAATSGEDMSTVQQRWAMGGGTLNSR